MPDLLLFSLVSLLASALVCYLIRRFDHFHRQFSHDHELDGVQKIHKTSVPRIGGLAIFIGIIVAFLAMLILPHQVGLGRPYLGLLILVPLPILIGGLVEDVTKQVTVRQRLVLSFVSAGLGAILLQAVVPNFGIPWLDRYTCYPLVMLAFTVFSVGGVINSFNLIDGINGLLAGFVLIVFAAIAVVAYQVADFSLVMMSLISAGAVLGFLAWNWPRGSIFLGDGGAYLLGSICATLLVMLIARNPEVSPWFPLVLVGYPVFETMFSIYRRKFFLTVRHDEPDNLHLHQLIYRWICIVRPENDRLK